MPDSAQLLYFHLGLKADDDGIVEAYPTMKLLGTAPDNLKVLIAKSFLKQLNDEQVVFIVDWLEHNTIRADRKIDSIYKHLLPKDTPLIEAKSRADRGNINTGIVGRPKKGLKGDGISKDKLSKVNKDIDNNKIRELLEKTRRELVERKVFH